MATYTPRPAKGFPGWFEIPGYAGYAANRKGEVLTKKTRNSTLGGNAGRYLKVDVYRDGDEKSTLRYVHDLVCRAFHGPPKKGQVVLHKNNKRKDNRPNNLKWGTQQQNVKDAYKDGLKVSKENYPPSAHW